MTRDSSYLTPIDDKYETCEKTYAEIKIYGDDLDPNAVTIDLGISPSGSQKKGEVRRGAGDQETHIVSGGWFLSSDGHVKSKDLRRHLDWLLARLLPAKERILALQDRKGIKMSVDCVWWSAFGDGGPTLWPQQMRGLADLNLECSFDLSFPEEG